MSDELRLFTVATPMGDLMRAPEVREIELSPTTVTGLIHDLELGVNVPSHSVQELHLVLKFKWS